MSEDTSGSIVCSLRRAGRTTPAGRWHPRRACSRYAAMPREIVVAIPDVERDQSEADRVRGLRGRRRQSDVGRQRNGREQRAGRCRESASSLRCVTAARSRVLRTALRIARGSARRDREASCSDRAAGSSAATRRHADDAASRRRAESPCAHRGCRSWPWPGRAIAASRVTTCCVIQLQAPHALHATSRATHFPQQAQQQLLAGARTAAGELRGDAQMHHSDVLDILTRIHRDADRAAVPLSIANSDCTSGMSFI